MSGSGDVDTRDGGRGEGKEKIAVLGKVRTPEPPLRLPNLALQQREDGRVGDELGLGGEAVPAR